MDLDKTITKTIPQKIKQAILGKENPNFLTRVSVGAGFLVWIYLFSWHLLTFLSLILMGGIKPGWRYTVEGSFQRVGSKLYGFADTVNTLFVHSVAQFALFFIILLGLILIWRKKKIGFLFYVAGSVGSVLATVFILSADFLLHETSNLDFILIGASTLYFGIGALWFYKFKGRKERELEEAQQSTTAQA